MDPKDLIENYVEDVVRRLPRRQRGDVGFELRALLGEELQGKADDAGRAPDETMAMDLLRTFGAPATVADRYRPAGTPIIDAQQARTFEILALGGVALQWAISLPLAFAGPGGDAGAAGSLGDLVYRLGRWWVSGGLGALWWPGFLLIAAIIARWLRRFAPEAAPWTPRVVDRDRINRMVWTLGLAAAVAGAGILIFLPWLIHQVFGGQMGRNIGQALAYDAAFRWRRGPWLLPLWAAQIALFAVLIVHGRWRKLTRRIDIAISLAVCGLMVWFIAAGPIFQARPTDGIVKFAMAVIALIALIDACVKLYRDRSSIRWPGALARPPGA